MIDYGFVRELDVDFDAAVEMAKERLKEEGFGVLTSIDVQDKLREKLGIEFERYVILGACDPASAHKALLAEENIGLMLPCNVIVYESHGRTRVAAVRPTVAMQMIDNLDLKRIAKDVERRLKHVMESLEPVTATV